MAVGNVVNPATQLGTIPGATSPTGGSATTVNTAAPVSAVPGIANPTAPVQNNPFAAPVATAPATATTASASVPGGVTANSPSTVQASGLGNPTQSQGTTSSDSLLGDFQDTYGQGTGTAITNLLSSMGTVDSNAIQATIANTDLAAGKQYANIQSGEAASGVTANSSTAALAAGDFYSGVNAQLQQTIGSEEESEQSQVLNTLVNEGTAHGTDASTLDSIMNGLTDAGEIGGAIFGV
jgi:hypothetical protein